MTLSFNLDLSIYRNVVVPYMRCLAGLNVLFITSTGEKINKKKCDLELSIYRNVVVPYVKDLAGLNVLSLVLMAKK